jgi:trans-aconitate 2-methyltransferase
MPDWDASRYHRLSDPQVAWGRAVLKRLDPNPGERILDLGCGTGRLTREIAGQPGIRVVGLDRSAAMVAETAGQPGRRMLVRADGAALPFVSAFDAVFSAATFHWILDHDRLFASVHTALKAGGRLVAQCGGEGNLRRLIGRTHRLMAEPRYASCFGTWSDPWIFAGVAETRARLERAGYTDIDVSIEDAPTTLPGHEAFADFISCVCVRYHVDRLPADVRASFVGALTDQAATDDPAYTLDYQRLNIHARKVNA